MTEGEDNGGEARRKGWLGRLFRRGDETETQQTPRPTPEPEPEIEPEPPPTIEPPEPDIQPEEIPEIVPEEPPEYAPETPPRSSRHRSPRRWPSRWTTAAGSHACGADCRARPTALPRASPTCFTKRRLDDEALEELEELLITADLGVATAGRVVKRLARSRFNQEVSPDEIKAALADEIAEVLEPVAQPLDIDPARKPHVVLVVGVNGSGKTTTIASSPSSSVTRACRSAWPLATPSAPRRSNS